MKKKILFSIVIIAILGGIFYCYLKITIFNVNKVTGIDIEFTKKEAHSDVVSIMTVDKSFYDAKSIAEFTEIINSLKLVDKVDTNDKAYTTYKITIHNKGENTTDVELRLSSDNFGEWIILARSLTAMPKAYIIPSKQAGKLYDILKDL